MGQDLWVPGILRLKRKKIQILFENFIKGEGSLLIRTSSSVLIDVRLKKGSFQITRHQVADTPMDLRKFY